jgi:hypothetical protein
MLLLNLIVGLVFLASAIHMYKKHRAAKAEYLATNQDNYRTIARINFGVCIGLAIVALGNFLKALTALLG